MKGTRMVSKRSFRQIGVAIGTAAVIGTAITHVAAQTDPTVLLVLDKDALDYGPPPHLIPLDGVDGLNSKVGLRDELPYFSGHVDQTVILSTAQNGDPGWFTLTTVPTSWPAEAGTVDGLRNFELAGAGLGSPDENGDRETLLRNVPGVAVLGADGLTQLAGKQVCAIVYATNISAGGANTDLTGETYGVIGFKVLALLPSDNPMYPNVEVQVLDGHEVCAGSLALLAGAPSGN